MTITKQSSRPDYVKARHVAPEYLAVSARGATRAEGRRRPRESRYQRVLAAMMPQIAAAHRKAALRRQEAEAAKKVAAA